MGLNQQFIVEYNQALNNADASGVDRAAAARRFLDGGSSAPVADTNKGRSGSYLRNSIKDRQSNSFQNYLAGKQKYGSSSAWYDNTVEEEKKQQTLVEKLQNQIKYREQNEWANTVGGGLDSLSPFQDSPSENYQSLEDLQKELKQAQRDLERATENLNYASEWRYYDADQAWLESVNKSGQDWGSISDALATMTERTRAVYDERLKALTEAEKTNQRIEQMRRQGLEGDTAQLKFTDELELRQLQEEVKQLGELAGMAERRYTYSLDELAKDSSITEWGRLRAEGIAAQDEKAYSENIQGYISGMESGRLGSVTGKDMYKGYTADYRPNDGWNEQQRNRYYVILNRQGEEAAGQYAVQVNTQNNLEAQQSATEGYYEFGKARSLDNAEGFKQTVGAALADTGRGLVGTVANVAGMPGELFEFVDKTNRMRATGAYTGSATPWLSDYGEAISRGRAETLNERYSIGEKGLGDLYNLTNSMAQSLVYGNIAGTAGTLTLFFGSAANQGFDDAMSRGATGEQAMAFGLLSGVAEAAAEFIPMENLLNADKSMARGFLKSALIQAGFEGLEEGETSILNTIADQLVIGDKSAINSAIAARMEQGESYQQAAKAEWGNYAKGVVWDIIGGAISGAGSSAIQYGINMSSPYRADAQGAYRYGADAEQLGKEAAELKDPEDKKTAELGKKVAERAAQGKSISNATAQKLVKKTDRASMVDAVEIQVNQRIKDIRSADARKLANSIVSQSRGEKITEGMQKLLDEHADVAEQLRTELERGNTAQWAQEIGVRGEDIGSYGLRDLRNLKELGAELENISAAKPEDMKPSVSIGDVSGEVSGFRMRGNSPQIIVTSTEGKEQYVPLDKAMESGELPGAVAKLAYLSAGQGQNAEAIYSLYEPGQDVAEYVSAMENAISTVAANVSSREAFNKSDAAQMLTEAQRDYAWQQGQQQREKKRESRSNTKSSTKQNKPRKQVSVKFGGAKIGGVIYKATAKSRVKAADLRVIERIAEAANVNVVFYESDSIDGKYQGANGFYRKGTIYLDVHAGARETTQQDAILLTAAHELTHHIRENAEAEYDRLKEFIVETLLESGQDFEAMVQDKLKDKGMSRDDAVEEVIADACEMVLKDSKAVEKLAKEHKSLAQTIADWLHQFYEDIKTAFEGVEARSREAKAMTDYMDELVKLWDDALIAASKSEAKGSGKTKASYAGRKAKTADQSLYQQAVEMEKAGKDSETIRKQTGWFKGMDGQWRYEISDADMQFSRKGFFTNPDVIRFNELNEKFIYRTITDEELAEVQALGENLKGVRKSPKYLREYIKHDALFKAYPELEDVEVAFDDLEGERAHYNARTNKIVVDNRLRTNDEQLKNTIVHEIQHAIQHIEGFSKGASPAYWQSRLDDGYAEKQKAEAVAKADEKYETLFQEAPEELKNKIREINRAKIADNWNLAFELSDKLYESEYAEQYAAIDDAEFERRVARAKEYEYNASDLYFNTAGEIEARDTAGRRKLTAEERKNTRPDIDRKDVVFAQSSVSYSKSEDDNSTIKKQIAASSERLNAMAPVATVSASNLPKGGKNVRDWAVNLLKATGYKVDRQDFGIIEFSPKHIAEGIKYLSEDAEIAAFSALPKVLKRGIVIDSHEKHKGNLRDSVTIAAPIVINGVRGNMAVAITVTTKNHYHVHRVVMPDGSKFTFEVNKKKTEPTMYSAAKAGEETKDSVYNENVSQDVSKVNYSRRDSSEGLTKEEARAQAQAYTRLKAENAALQRRLEYWKGQTKRTKQRTINRGDADRFARSLIKIHGSTVDADWLKQQIYALGDYLVQSEDLDWETARRMAWEIAVEVIENAEAEDDSGAYDNRDDILADIKGFRFRLDEMYKNDLPEGFRKQYRNKIHVSFTEGRAVDSIYEELQDSYGKALFPDMPTQADMLVMIGDAYDTVSAPPEIYNPYRYSMNETINSVTYDILDMMLSEDIRQTAPTRADREAEKLRQQKAEDRQKLNQLRSDKNARIAEIRRQEAARRQEAVAAERAKKHERVAAVREYYQNMMQRQRETRKENAAAKKYRDSVYDKVTTLSNWLIKNSDKEHIPEALKAPLIELLNSLDLSSRQMLKGGEATQKDKKYTDLMQQLRDILSKQSAYMKDPGTAEGLDVFLDLPSGFDQTIEQHINSVKTILRKGTDAWTGGAIAYMNSDQLRDLDFILTTLTTSIKQINQFITDSRYASVIESARDTMSYLRQLGPDLERSIGREKAAQFLQWSNTLPIYAFKRFGAAGTERFMALAKGWAQMAVNAEAAIKYAEDTYEGTEAQEWEGAIHQIELSSGKTVRMSEAQIMGLYCSFKREQARGHLLAGGMRVGDITPAKATEKKIVQPKAVQLTQDDIIKITGLLSGRQIEVADALQSYLNSTCADWGNEVSMARFGYRQFTESNYYPIETDSNNHPAVDPQARETDIFRLLNMSMTKALTPNANNSIVIFSIFDVFAAHTADMAKYNALALPILDLLKWYNYKDKQYSDVTDSFNETSTQLYVESVQGDVEAAYGKMAQNYVINFLKDLNGKREGGRNEEVLKGMVGRYKAAAVGANLRVAIQQPTSIVRASYLISPAYLMRGAAMKGGVEEALKNSGLAKWKNLGYFDTNIARNMREQIKHTDSLLDSFRDKSMWLAEQGDKITWGSIWNACKLEQQESKGLSGDELIQATTERFHEVILSTQVIDSTISRSDMMRNQSLAVAEVTSFMSEPTVSYNMLMDSMMELTMAKRRGESGEVRAKLWKEAGKALSIYVVSQATTAAAAAIVDAMRDDDEYQNFIQKWLEHVKTNFLQSANPLNLLPIIGELINTLAGVESHKSMMFEPIVQISKAWPAAVDLIKSVFNAEAELKDPNRTNWGRIYQLLQAVGSISGVATASFLRDAKAVWNMSGALVTGKKIRFYDSGLKNDVKYAVKNSYISEEEAIALLVNGKEYEDPDDAYWQVQEWLNAEDSEWSRYNDVYAAVLAKNKTAYDAAVQVLEDHGIPARSVRAEIRNQIGRWYVTDGKIGDTDAKNALIQYAGMGQIDAQHLVDEWRFEKNEGIKFSELQQAYVDGKYDDKAAKGFLINFGHKYAKDAEEMVQEWKCEKETGIKFTNLSDAYVHDEISERMTVEYLMRYGDETQEDAEIKVAQWSLAREYGIRYGSSEAGIKSALIEGYISDETAKTIMIVYGGKTEEEAEDYVNQYHFTEETGYGFSEIEEAYADGVITYDEMVEWYKEGSIYTHGSEETAREYADVAVWKAEVPGASTMNRDGLEKWTKYGKYMSAAGLGREDFAKAWSIYSAASSEYDIYGNKTKEKAQVFFERLYALYESGVYSFNEMKAMAKTVYSNKYINKYAPW